MPTIQQHLEQLKLQDLLKELDRFQCQASFREGRKFSLNALSGRLTFNEMISIVHQKSLEAAGLIDGIAIYTRLESLHQLGEKELAKRSWVIRLTTLIKRCFTFWKRTPLLKNIRQRQGYNNLDNYVRSQSGVLLKELNRTGLNLTPKNLKIINWNIINATRSSGIEIEVTHKDKVYKPSRIPHDPTSTLPILFNQALEEIKQTWPKWLKIQPELDKIAFELKKSVTKKLEEWSASTSQKHKHTQDTIQVDATDPIPKSCFTLNCTINFSSQTAEKSDVIKTDLCLDAISIIYDSEASLSQVTTTWKEELDKKLFSFLDQPPAESIPREFDVS